MEYVQATSLGTAYAWVSIFGMLATITATSVIIKLQEIYTIEIIYDILGGITIIVSFILIFGLKEIPKEKGKDNNKIQLRIGLS